MECLPSGRHSIKLEAALFGSVAELDEGLVAVECCGWPVTLSGLPNARYGRAAAARSEAERKLQRRLK